MPSVCATRPASGNFKLGHCRSGRPEAFCNRRSQISNLSEITAHAGFFAGSGRDAREIFHAACRTADITPVPYYAPTDVVSDSRPIVEVARFGRGDARQAIVVTGGSWEDEGVCAAGIQSSLLHEPLGRRLPTDVALVLVHAIAPPGFADPRIDLAEPSARQWSQRALAAAESRFETFMVGAGQSVSGAGPRAAIAGKPWQEILLRRITDQFVTGLDRVCLLDIRTGPSQFGASEILCCAADGTAAHLEISTLFAEDGADRPVPSGGCPGDLARGLLAAGKGSGVAAAVLEFGTYSIGSILGVGGDRIFYPERDDWRDMVRQSATRTIWRAAARLGSAAIPSTG